MFHVLLVLPILIMLVIVAFVVLFAIVAVVAALIGGTTVALLIKNRIAKKLLFIGFCILFLVGFLCLLPIITAYLGLSTIFLIIAVALIYICIAILAITGIKISSFIKYNIGKTLLIIVFSVILASDIILAVFTALARAFFM